MTTTQNTNTSGIDVEAIHWRAKEATYGPWRVVEEHGRDISDEGWSRIAIQSEAGSRAEVAEIIGDDVSYGAEEWAANAEFIAHAREDIPTLLTVLEAIRALHTESPAGFCPSCYRQNEVSDTDDGLVAWPCPTLQAMGIEAVAR